MKKYDHRSVESKWQAIWEKTKPNKVEADPSKPKYYVLDMFPYPSGAGLHVGHVVGYTGTDIIARYKRQKGFNVLHPMGWDSFGLPAEQYAVRTGTHPQITTEKNINTYRRQLKSLGFSYDWDRELATSDPSFYRWTQWIFTKLYETGLAYQSEALVNYCPYLGTVLANEEVENGRSKEGGHLVERRPLKQWMFKITAYAERLLEDLKDLDWPEGLKRLQINWIGKSEGALVHFKEEKTQQIIEVFTTCPNTLFGASFLVLAPEHPLIKTITTPSQQDAVNQYIKEAALKSDLDRGDLNEAKTGVFTGAYALNPATQEKMPIWITDYVLMGYGTGAVMGVPGHDMRDFVFATQFKLPIRAVVEPDLKCLPEEERDPAIIQKVLSAEICWPHDGKSIHSANDEISLNGLDQEEAKKTVVAWLEKKGLGQKKTSYKLRDWLFSRQRYWGEPFPILHLANGQIRVLDLDELPLTLPEVLDYKPSGDGQSPLAKVEEWVQIVDPKSGLKARRETNTMPNWAGSCWYYLRFCDPLNEKAAWDKHKESYWMPVDLYVGGAEHAVLHLLYSRFWHKVLFDLGLVSTKEPFQKLYNQGLVVARSFQKENGVYVSPDEVIEEGGKLFLKGTKEPIKSQMDKMSKSKLNGITPDEMIEEFGADSLRMYEMFMGPLDKEKLWNTDAVAGCRRFLNRFFDMAQSEKLTSEFSVDGMRLAHRLLAGVLKDVESLQFNTAIAKMMEFINEFTRLESYPKEAVKIAVQCLFPFAPHIASELWEDLGEKSSIDKTPYPEVEKSYLEDHTITYVVQVNGKVRGRFELPKDQTQEVILEEALKNPAIHKFTQGGKIDKVIFVPNKLLNLVITAQS